MTRDAARLVAGVLARRLGLEPDELEATITESPIGAAVALSLMEPAQRTERADTARIVSFVGSMVGACPVCLGEDYECGECKGNGKPGSRQANADALVRWIALPLHQVGLCVGRPRNTPVGDNQRGG